jgi:hypothetical protein
MSIRGYRTLTMAGAAALAGLALSGCVGGTTYGTGVTQEEQTLKDVYTMFNLSTEKKNIDYSPRPDLIVPDNKQALVEPIENGATTSNAQWPETPEERIARIRAQAGEVDARTGDYGINEQLRKKEGIGIETGYVKRKFVPGQTDRDGNPLLNASASEEARQEVLKRKAELTGSSGPTTRKYLTEPPVAYRQPVASAPSGAEAYSPEEQAARDEAERKAKLKRIQELGGRNG